MIYKIYECEVKRTTTGKELKKLVLQEEGKQYPYKNVTAWSDSAPDYENLRAGGTTNGYLKLEDSDQINPHTGKPYVNRTLLEPRNENGTIAVSCKCDVFEPRIKRLEDKVFGKQEPLQTDNTVTTDEIDPNDIPF